MRWSGNRWIGGHWPHWGGVLDWTGQPEPDFSWLTELGQFFDKNSDRLLKYPVDASAAALTDFDQRAALDVYPHTPASKKVLVEVFDTLHRLGIGADSLNFQRPPRPGSCPGMPWSSFQRPRRWMERRSYRPCANMSRTAGTW